MCDRMCYRANVCTHGISVENYLWPIQRHAHGLRFVLCILEPMNFILIIQDFCSDIGVFLIIAQCQCSIMKYMHKWIPWIQKNLKTKQSARTLPRILMGYLVHHSHGFGNGCSALTNRYILPHRLRRILKGSKENQKTLTVQRLSLSQCTFMTNTFVASICIIL